MATPAGEFLLPHICYSHCDAASTAAWSSSAQTLAQGHISMCLAAPIQKNSTAAPEPEPQTVPDSAETKLT